MSASRHVVLRQRPPERRRRRRPRSRAARACVRTMRLLPFAVDADLQMECADVLEETLAADFAQIYAHTSRTYHSAVGGEKPTSFQLHTGTVHPHFPTGVKFHLPQR